MNEWDNREAFEALAERCLEHSRQRRAGEYVFDPSLNSFTISTETARTHVMTAPRRAGKQGKMTQNTKAYQVELSTGEIETVEANEVQETANRVKFLGYVAGYNDHSFNSEVVRSYRSDIVDSYRLVPVQERNEATVGKYVYRVSLTDGTSKDVQGDVISHNPGSEGKPGRYVVGTRQHGASNNRTEYLVPDHRVSDITRVDDEGNAVADEGDN